MGRGDSMSLLHVLNRLSLVGGEREGEELFHLALPRGVWTEGVAFGDGTQPIEVDQLLGH